MNEQIEQEARRAWDNDPGTRAEFKDNFELFKHWYEADKRGLIKDFKPNDTSREQRVKLTSEDLRGRDFRAEAQRLWESDPTAKKDFGGDFETFLCWYEADQKGLVKNLGGAARG
jgi:hypothetical protein